MKAAKVRMYDPAQRSHPKWEDSTSRLPSRSGAPAGIPCARLWRQNALRTSRLTERHCVPTVLPALLLAAVAAGLLVPVGPEPAEAAFPGGNGKIVFASGRTSGPGVDNPEGDFELFEMNPDGTGLEQLTVNTLDDSGRDWESDGVWIVYTSHHGNDDEIFMRSYGGDYAQTRRLTTNTAFDGTLAFSPDGSKIAFYGGRVGNPEIYVMDTADTDNDGNGDILTRLTNTLGDFAPAWSPDGTKIAFECVRGGDSEIYVMMARPQSKKNCPKNLIANNVEDWKHDWRPIP